MLDSGSVYTWGLNSEGQCGFPDEDEILEPAELQIDETVVSLSCGYYHTAVVTGETYSFEYFTLYIRLIVNFIYLT